MIVVHRASELVRGQVMKLIVITGLAVSLKAQLTITLIDSLLQSGISVTLINNNNALIEVEVPTIRLPTGCICCDLAYKLIPLLKQISTPVAVLCVSSLAMPDALSVVLDNLSTPVLKIALIDEHIQVRFPALVERLHLNADLVVDDTLDLSNIEAD